MTLSDTSGNLWFSCPKSTNKTITIYKKTELPDCLLLTSICRSNPVIVKKIFYTQLIEKGQSANMLFFEVYIF